MQALFLVVLVSGASAATLHDLSDRMTVPPGERTPISLEQMEQVISAESAALPEVQSEQVENPGQKMQAFVDNLPGAKMRKQVAGALGGITDSAATQWQRAYPKPADHKPDHFDSPEEERAWTVRQGNRINQGDGGYGDLLNTLEGLQNLNDHVSGQITKKFGFMEKRAVVTEDPKEADPAKGEAKDGSAVGEAIVADDHSDKYGTQAKEDVKTTGPWDITFYVLLSLCVFVFGWWAVKVGLHERAADAASEFAFNCKKWLSTTLKGNEGSAYMAHDDKSESSYEASEGSGSSMSSKGALNSHLQGVIDRVKTNLGEEQKAESSDKHYTRK